MFTLAHFSDPHIGPLPIPRLHELFSKRITGYLNHRRNRSAALTGNVLDTLLDDLNRQKPDHIALTGDIVNIALDAEIENARHWLKKVGTPDDVSLVPGNHDAYVSGALEKAKESWAPYWLGDKSSKIDSVKFPYLRRRGPIAIVALSTGIPTLPFMATGTLGSNQIEIARKLLNDLADKDCFRIILIHHPPFVEKGRWLKRLTDYRAFNTMIKSIDAELILHGHTHRRNITHIAGLNQPIPVIGVPSASSRFSGKHEPSRYNIFEIDRNNHQWQCTQIERGITQSGKFEELARLTL